MAYASFSTETLAAPASFIRGDFPRITRKVTITGGSWPAGAVLGRITASGKHSLSLAAATDGSQTPRVILAEPANATAGDVEAIVYLSGDFLPDGLTIGAGHTAASIADGLRTLSIFL